MTEDERKPKRRRFKRGEKQMLLTWVQPGLNGLMDGSVSTLAPIFAVAFATHRPLTAFFVGLAAATGGGISMAFAEALSDSGDLTGRGAPWKRALANGGGTFVGGIGHTLPFLIPHIGAALGAAYLVVVVELLAIAAIRWRFMQVPLWRSVLETGLGGVLVFLAAVVFGNA